MNVVYDLLFIICTEKYSLTYLSKYEIAVLAYPAESLLNPGFTKILKNSHSAKKTTLRKSTSRSVIRKFLAWLNVKYPSGEDCRTPRLCSRLLITRLTEIVNLDNEEVSLVAVISL